MLGEALGKTLPTILAMSELEFEVWAEYFRQKNGSS
jgi:hypothetical protein